MKEIQMRSKKMEEKKVKESDETERNKKKEKM